MCPLETYRRFGGLYRLLLPSSIVKMEAPMYSAMLAKFHHTELRHIPEDVTLAIVFLECLVKCWLGVVVYCTLTYILRITLTRITII
jgi:hypothetical protein